jgi:hypothetical protein
LNYFKRPTTLSTPPNSQPPTLTPESPWTIVPPKRNKTNTSTTSHLVRSPNKSPSAPFNPLPPNPFEISVFETHGTTSTNLHLFHHSLTLAQAIDSYLPISPFTRIPQKGDGDCFYHSIRYFLDPENTNPKYSPATMRDAISDFLLTDPRGICILHEENTPADTIRHRTPASAHQDYAESPEFRAATYIYNVDLRLYSIHQYDSHHPWTVTEVAYDTPHQEHHLPITHANLLHIGANHCDSLILTPTAVPSPFPIPPQSYPTPNPNSSAHYFSPTESINTTNTIPSDTPTRSIKRPLSPLTLARTPNRTHSMTTRFTSPTLHQYFSSSKQTPKNEISQSPNHYQHTPYQFPVSRSYPQHSSTTQQEQQQPTTRTSPTRPHVPRHPVVPSFSRTNTTPTNSNPATTKHKQAHPFPPTRAHKRSLSPPIAPRSPNHQHPMITRSHTHPLHTHFPTMKRLKTHPSIHPVLTPKPLIPTTKRKRSPPLSTHPTITQYLTHTKQPHTPPSTSPDDLPP